MVFTTKGNYSPTDVHLGDHSTTSVPRMKKRLFCLAASLVIVGCTPLNFLITGWLLGPHMGQKHMLVAVVWGFSSFLIMGYYCTRPKSRIGGVPDPRD